ncbi:30S ribosomal protein S20 [Candidatus Similichlamydia epinepheli]|uniref:30S ribosomal protein S20 n=1 Tax=Candidatus Similichlamydia epinepheli TaxID=1903953 RepID=UPI000D35E15D|nr:30S ribosomal protein S20 [Candidatus Similichlamydia epinepheli]
MQQDKGEKSKRRTSAEKRIIQAEKKRQLNRAAKSRVHTSVRALLSSIQSKSLETASSNLDRVFSLLDKGLKTGLNRMKSKLSKRTNLLKTT